MRRVYPWVYSSILIFTCNKWGHAIGDGSCDDINNYSWCQYDNGDCCVQSGYENIWNDFCTECLCKSNETNYPSSLAIA